MNGADRKRAGTRQWYLIGVGVLSLFLLLTILRTLVGG